MSAKIFINYRKDDSPWNSLALYQELIEHFPKQNIFKDFNTIKPGRDFVESIESALEACDVLLVLISKNWLTITNDKGLRRLDEENDFVRLEIATALKRNIIVIPILFDGARMPSTADLPEDLKKLARRQSIEIDKGRFEFDTQRLVDAIKEHLPDEVPVADKVIVTGIPEEMPDINEKAKGPIPGDEISGNHSLKYWLMAIAAISLIYFLFNAMKDRDPGNIGKTKETDKDSTSYTNPVEPYKADEKSGAIHMELHASGHTVRTGDPTEITVMAYDENKYPLSNASVHLEGHGGYFLQNNSPSIDGPTDQNGMFRATLQVTNRGGTSFSVIATVIDKGRDGAQEQLTIHVVHDARVDTMHK